MQPLLINLRDSVAGRDDGFSARQLNRRFQKERQIAGALKFGRQSCDIGRVSEDVLHVDAHRPIWNVMNTLQRH